MNLYTGLQDEKQYARMQTRDMNWEIQLNVAKFDIYRCSIFFLDRYMPNEFGRFSKKSRQNESEFWLDIRLKSKNNFKTIDSEWIRMKFDLFPICGPEQAGLF